MEIDPINGVNIYANIIVHIVICDLSLVANSQMVYNFFITLFRTLILRNVVHLYRRQVI